MIWRRETRTIADMQRTHDDSGTGARDGEPRDDIALVWANPTDTVVSRSDAAEM